MALLHHNIVSSRSAIPLAGARFMALLHNDTSRWRSLHGAAPQCASHHSKSLTIFPRCATVKATVKATVVFRAT
jgi:hypothetical protein